MTLSGLKSNYAQFGDTRTPPFTWPAEPMWQPEWTSDSTSENTGAIVLDDDFSIRFKNKKPQFLALFFERKRIIKFTSEQGIIEHGRFYLPESLDPLYDQRHVAWEKRTDHPDPQWTNVRLDHFAARVIRPDGTWEDLPVFTKMWNTEVEKQRTIENAWRRRIDVRGILPGDVVEVTWKYMMPYDLNYPETLGWRGQFWGDNWRRLTSWRIFFHEDIPIRKQHVELKYNRKHGLLVGGSAFYDLHEDGDDMTIDWAHKELPATMNEVNIRPGNDLLYATVRMEADDPRYVWRDRYTGLPVKQDYWLYVVRSREQRALWWKRVAERNFVMDKQTKLLQAFVAKTAGEPNVLRPDQRMVLMHNVIAEKFTFEQDRLWYLDKDREVAKIGEQLDEQRLRKISRYDMYAKLINELKVDYSTAYVLDKRIGQLNDRYMTPLWDSEFLFALSSGSGVLWMHPKHSDVGLLANELPFYWQGSAALAVDVEALIQDIPKPPIFVDLPEENPTDNRKGVEYTVNVDLNGSTAKGAVRVFLNGQWSTLGRCAYMDFEPDSTVDPLYSKPAFGTDGIRAISNGKNTLDTDPPFMFRTDAELELPELLSISCDTFSVDLDRFIAHVLPTNFSALYRNVPFYWDFLQEDQRLVDLHFNEPVFMLSSLHDNLLVTSNSAQYILHIEQLAPDHIQVESRLVISREKEEVEEMKALETLIDAATQSGRSVLFKRFGKSE